MTDESSDIKNFIHDVIDADLASGKHDHVVTRFPPEPNGYLHVGHAKAICLDFGTALKYGGICHLRMDDTDPAKESVEYVESIKEDVRWLGFDWGEHFYYASDYFERMYDCAVRLIESGRAYVCALSAEEFKNFRGVPTRPGKDSPYRSRPIEESLDLFKRMRAGEFDEGSYVLRAKVDMNSPNLHMRDPAIFRIKFAHHHRQGDTWCIYPTYDFAHCLEDSFEGITHSFCTLEFEVHRPIYDWILAELDEPCRPQQIEFARLNLTYTVMSKRKLQELVECGAVSGWDDPRMPTLAGMRRRGYPPVAIRNFCERIGVTKYESLTDVALLEHCVRDELNRTAERRLGVIDPLKVVITNYPVDGEEFFDAVNNPEDDSAGKRKIPFSRELYIERRDFMEEPVKKFRRLAPGREVRLRYACLVTCTDVVKDDDGEVIELHCEMDMDSRGGSAPDGRKVKGTIHWVSIRHSVEVELRQYDRLFNVENPASTKDGKDFKDHLNPNSLTTIRGYAEPSLAAMKAGDRFQFERVGYYCVDPDTTIDIPVLNRTAPLRDNWNKGG